MDKNNNSSIKSKEGNKETKTDSIATYNKSDKMDYAVSPNTPGDYIIMPSESVCMSCSHFNGYVCKKQRKSCEYEHY